MTLPSPRRPFPTAAIVLAVAGGAIGGTVSVRAGEVTQIADRCSLYGADYVDIGNDRCARVVGGIPLAPQPGWNGAANAGLRSDGHGMLPGATGTRHLRVQVDPDQR